MQLLLSGHLVDNLDINLKSESDSLSGRRNVIGSIIESESDCLPKI